MHSRIVGTGSYLPAHIVTNDDLAKRVDTSDAWIRTRTGIRERRFAAAVGDDERSRGAGRARRASRQRGIARRPTSISSSLRRPRRTWCSRRRRASCRPSSARSEGRRSTCRPCAADSSTRSRLPTAWSRRACARNALVVGRRSLFAHSRLEGSRHVRALRRRCGRGRARALASAGHRLCAPARGWPLPRYPVRPGTVAEGAISGTPYVTHGRPCRVQVRGQGHGRGRRRGARSQRRRRVGASTGSFRTRPTFASSEATAKKLEDSVRAR